MGLLDLKRKPGENEYQYIWRIASQKEAGLIPMSWDELTTLFNEELEKDHSSEATYRKPYLAAKAYYDAVFSKMNDPGAQESKLRELRRDIQIEREKLRSEKVEVNRWLREYARDELIAEKFVDAIRNIEPLPLPGKVSTVVDGCRKVSTSGVLCFGDEHFGAEFELKNPDGSVMNAYSPEIFADRMWKLYDRVLDIVWKEKLTDLRVYNLGDYIDGIIRASQLMHLRYGVIEGTIEYAEFMSMWLNELSKHVCIKFQMAHGNHSELRLINQPKGSFDEENTGKFVLCFLKERLRGSPNIEFVDNPSGLIYDEVCGKTIVGLHGEVKDMEEALHSLSLLYKTPIDILVGGHIHHYKAECVSDGTYVFNVPSIIGVDKYSVKLRKSSRPGALLIVLNEGDDDFTEHHINL